MSTRPQTRRPSPRLRNQRPAILTTSVAALLALCLTPREAQAQTWLDVPGSGNWNTATNWTPATVPNGSSATATFDTSITLGVSVSSGVTLGALTFTANATSPYTITVDPTVDFSFLGGGIANNSGASHTFVTAVDGSGDFATISFNNHATAGLYSEFINDGLNTGGSSGGVLDFLGSSTAGGVTITNNGGTTTGAAGGSTIFSAAATAGSATIITNGGANGGAGGTTYFETAAAAAGGTASAITNGNGVFDISQITSTGLTIGSIAGSGFYNLGSKTLTVGGNGLSTTVSGVIEDGGIGGGLGSSLVKTGTGTLTLAGANTYTGTTTINGGSILVNGSIASTAAVTVNSGGTLGGMGTIAGPVTVSSGGTLAHSNSNIPGTITVGALTLNSGSKVDYELGVPGTAGGTANDLTVVNGNLTLGGALNISDLTGFGIGTYEIFSYTGALTGSTMSFGAMPAGFTASDFSIQTSTAHQVDLVVSAVPTVQNWGGGSGTWGGGTITNFGTGTGTVTVASNISAGEVRFGAGAGAYTFNVNAGNTITISGAGITNSSSSTQTFFMEVGSGGAAGGMNFTNSATAGNATITVTGSVSNMTGLDGATIQFSNTSTAGSAQITNGNAAFDDGGGGSTVFANGSNAGTATITNQGGYAPGGPDYNGNGQTTFYNTSSAGNAEIINQQGSANQPSYGGVTTFQDNSTAGNATIYNVEGVDTTSYGQTYFAGNSTAGTATIINQGATIALASGGVLNFGGTSTAGSAQIENKGGSGGEGGATYFIGNASAGNATIYNYPGNSGGLGGGTYFTGNADGGTARVITNGNGFFDISGLTDGGMNIGSIEGSGTYYLGGNTLTVGGNNFSSIVSGTIQDGGEFGGAGGSIVKTGLGTLTLDGANTYTGTTTIVGGTLQVNGSIGSTAAVTVNSGGTLGGMGGTIDGPVTINSGGTLAHGTSGTAATLTVGSLTLNTGSTLNYQLGTPGTAGGGVNDLTIVNGNLMVSNATVNIAALSGFGSGTYELITYTGSLAGDVSNWNVGTLPAGYVTSEFTFDYSVNGRVNLDVTAPQFWNGPVTVADGTANGGTGTWDNVRTNWTNAAGSTNLAWQGTNAVFAGGAGTVTLGANIGFSSISFVTPGYTIAGSGAFALNVNGNAMIVMSAGATISAPITGNGSLAISGSSTLTLSGAITQSGGSLALTQSGSGTTILTNANNTFTNGTTITTGTVQVGTSGTAGSVGIGPISVVNGGTFSLVNISGNSLANGVVNGVGGVGTFNINSANTNTIQSPLGDGGAGQLALTQTGTGTTILQVHNNYSGGTTVSNGILQIGAAIGQGGSAGSGNISVSNGATLLLFNLANSALANNVSNGVSGVGTVNINSANTNTLSGVLSDGAAGQLVLEQSGAGTTILTGSDTYTGTTTIINGGTLQANVAGALPAPAADGGTGTARSAVLMDQTGTGGSTLALGANQAIASLTGPTSSIVNLGANTLTIGVTNPSTSSEFDGVIGDGGQGGGLTKDGTSTLILGGANTYTGTTTVKGGALIVNGSLASGSTVNVNSGGTLAGTGTAAGAVNILAGGNLNPGDVLSPGTLTVGSLVLNAGSISNFRLAQAGAVGGGVNDLVSVTGNLTIGGILNVTQLAGFGVGSYTLFTYGGTLTNNGFNAFEGLSGFDSISISTGVAHDVDLVVSNVPAQYWDGPTTVGNNTITGGNGNWNTTTTDWTNAGGSSNSAWQTEVAVFDAPSGTVTLTSAVSAQGLIFGSTGYVIAGADTLTLTGTPPTISVTNAGTSATISAKIAGTAGLTANGSGTLILTNAANSYTGGTTISNGTVQIGTASTAGSIGGGGVSIRGGGSLTLVKISGSTFASNVTNGVSGVGMLNIDSATAYTLSGTLTDGAAGQLALTQSGSKTTTLTNAGNTYSGATTVSGGILQIGTTSTKGSIGANSAVSVGNSATLSVINVSGGVLANTISNGNSGTGLVNVDSTTSLTLSGILSSGAGVLAFTQSGTGTTTLSGADTYTGATTVSAGTLQVGNGAAGNLAAGTTVTVSGSATLATDLGSGSTLPSNIDLSATGTALKAIQSGTNTLSGVISGKGVFDQNAPGGTTILSATETYTGLTNVNEGALTVNGSLAVGSTVAVATTGTLGGTGTSNGNATLTGNGTINFGTGGNIVGTLGVTGGNWISVGTVGGVITSSSGQFNIGGTLTASAGLDVTGGTLAGAGTLTGRLDYTSSASSTFGGVIADGTAPSVLIMNKASSTLILTGANTYIGATTISAGTIQLGDGATTGTSLGAGSVTVSGTGTLAINLPDASTFSKNVNLTVAGASLKAIQAGTNTLSGGISGAGGLNQDGTGTTLVTGTNSYTGVTSVTTGILQVDGTLAAGSTVNVAAAGTLAGAGTIAGTVNVISGGNLKAGDISSLGTLTVGKLVLSAGSNANFRLAAPGTTGGGVNDLINVTGNLTIAGNLNITELTGFGIGSYTLFTYGGTLTNTGFSSVNGIGGFASSVSTGVAHQVNLVVSGTAVTQYWDGTGAVNDSVISGGSGTWNNTTNNWTNSTGSTNSTWQAGTAVFAAPGGTVMVAAPISVQGLIFGSTGYTLSGSSALNLVGGSGTPPTISVSTAGTTATIGAPLTGKAGLTASGAGTLILTSTTNSYTGWTSITNGMVQVGTTATAGSIGGGTISIASGGTLTVINLHGNILANSVTNGVATTGTLNISSTTTNTLSGALIDGAAGQLTLIQSGTGTTILTNATNSFTGATTISKGTLQIGTATAAGSLGASSAVSVGPASTLSLVNVAGNTLANNISDGLSGTGLVSINSTANLTLSGALTNGTGVLALTQSGTGTTTLSGNNAYTGATTVTAGALEIGNGAAGNLAAGTIVTVSGTGTLTTDLASGGTFSNTVTDNSHVIATGASNNYTVSSLISGTGNFTKTGANVVTVTAANTYKGGTAVSAGTLLINNTAGSGTGTGAVAINSGGTLGGSGTISGATTLNSGGTLFPSAGSPGTPGTTLHGSSLVWNSGGTLTLQLGASVDDALVLTGALTKGSTGTYTLDLVNSGLVGTDTYNLTLVTFASSNFTAANFTVDLPVNYTGTLVKTNASLEIENLTDPPPGPGELPEGGDLAVAGPMDSEQSTPDNLTVTPTPEPGSATLLAFGGAALLGWRRRRTNEKRNARA